MSEIKDEKITRSWNRLRHEEGEIRGGVMTPDGFVLVAAFDWRGRGHVLLEVGIRGRAYRQLIEGEYSQRYLVTLANRFAAAVGAKADRRPEE